MRFLKFASVVLVVLLIAVIAAGISAQDDMGEMVVCDSDLILDLYIAEYYFGFGAYHEAMMMEEGDDMMMSVDLSSLDKGQFAGLFDSMMSMMDDGSMMGMMSEETMNSIMELAMMSEEDMMGMMEGMEEMTMLTPTEMMDEPETCAALRSELRDFYTLLAYSNMMMMEEGS